MSRKVTAEKAEVRAGRQGAAGGTEEGRGTGGTLTNGPGRCPDACQEQQGPCSESCHLGSGTAWHRPATCNRHHAGAVARPVLLATGPGHGASSALPPPPGGLTGCWILPRSALGQVSQDPPLRPTKCPQHSAGRGRGQESCHLFHPPPGTPGTAGSPSPVRLHFAISFFS